MQESLVGRTTETLALRNILNQELPIHKYGFLRRTFSHLYQAYEVKKFDYPQVVDQILRDERLRLAVEKMSLQQLQGSDRTDEEFYKELWNNNEQRAKKLLSDMRATISNDFSLR